MAQKDVIVLTCGKCGEDFLYEYSGRGAKPTYCPECRKEVTQLARQAYKEKMKNERKERKERKLQKITNKKLEELAKNSFVTAGTIVSNNSYEDRVAELLRKFDTIRVELCSIATEMSEFQSGYDKNDQTYLHKLENINADDVKETQMLIKEWQKSRNNRRNVKDLLALVQNTIDKIPYKSYANNLPLLKGANYNKVSRW